MRTDDGIDRRVLLQRALLLAGAVAMPGGFGALAAAAKEGKRFLSPVRYALLGAVADTIVPATDTPGAVAAGVPAGFDALLRHWASPERRADLIAALDAIGALGGSPGFAGLASDKRHALLAAHDSAALKAAPPAAPADPLKAAPAVADPNYGRLKQESPASKPADAPATAADPAVALPKKTIVANPMMAGPAVVDPAYAKLKELIVVLFYLSETALTHDLQYEHSPGEWQPSIAIAPGMRPYGGAGYI